MIAIDYNVVHAQTAHSDVRRRIGDSGPWDIAVLNGRGRAFEGHGSGPFSLKWMAKGRAHYRFDRRVHAVTRDCAVLLDRDAPYQLSFDGTGDNESYCLFFAPQLVAEAWASVEAGFGEAGEPVLRGFPSVPFSPPSSLLAQLDALHRNGTDADAGQLELRLLDVLGAIVAVAQHHRRLASRVPAAKPATRDYLVGVVEQARRLLLDTNGIGWTLERLAGEVGLSRFHLLRLFRALHGVTPIEYAERIRMRAAAEQLRTTDRPVSEVAAQFGYDSASAFAKAFRRHAGAAPTQWRRATI